MAVKISFKIAAIEKFVEITRKELNFTKKLGFLMISKSEKKKKSC